MHSYANLPDKVVIYKLLRISSQFWNTLIQTNKQTKTKTTIGRLISQDKNVNTVGPHRRGGGFNILHKNYSLLEREI